MANWFTNTTVTKKSTYTLFQRENLPLIAELEERPTRMPQIPIFCDLPEVAGHLVVPYHVQIQLIQRYFYPPFFLSPLLEL